MREVDYSDGAGRRFRVRVPEGCPVELYPSGIPVGPPSLGGLGLPLEVEVRLHNELHARGFLTARDVRRRPQEVIAALQAALRLDLQRIQQVYAAE